MHRYGHFHGAVLLCVMQSIAGTPTVTFSGNSISAAGYAFTVPAQGTGLSYAQACEHEMYTYSYLRESGYAPDASETSFLANVTAYTAVNSTLCDGRPRILGSLTPVSTGQATVTGFLTTTITGPGPQCSVQMSDCSQLQRSYLSASIAYLSSFVEGQYSGNSSPTMPLCTVSTSPDPACGPCTIHGLSVKLLYFPITTTPVRDMCALTATDPKSCPYGSTYSLSGNVGQFVTVPCNYTPQSSSLSSADHGPSLVSAGTTLYRNRAYVSFSTLYATNTCGRIGGAYSSKLIPVPSSDLYSLSGYHYAFSQAAYSFNFGDLIPPVPASAYLGSPYCENSFVDLAGVLNPGDTLNGIPRGLFGFCKPIIDAAYKPILAVPPQVRSLDSAWEQCLLGLEGLYDPPVALDEVSTIAGVTAPIDSSPTGMVSLTAAARPGSTVNMPTPGLTTPPIAQGTQAAQPTATLDETSDARGFLTSSQAGVDQSTSTAAIHSGGSNELSPRVSIVYLLSMALVLLVT